jgi:hypothetical protein
MRSSKTHVSVQSTELMIENPAEPGKPLLSLVPDKMSIYISFFIAQFSVPNYKISDENKPCQQQDFLLKRFRRIWHHQSRRGEFHDTNQHQEQVCGPLLPAAEGFAKVYFARRHGDMSLLRDGISDYGTALQKMRERIEYMHNSVAVDEVWDDTVFACLVLALCEVRLTSSV